MQQQGLNRYAASCPDIADMPTVLLCFSATFFCRPKIDLRLFPPPALALW